VKHDIAASTDHREIKFCCNSIEPVKSRIKEIIKKENLSDIKEWKTEFLKRKHSFTFQYLPLLSIMYNLLFLPCIVKPHQEHKRVFAPTGEELDFSNNIEKTSVYVLTEEKKSYEDIRPIKGIFVISDIALNYLHNQLDCNPDVKTKVNLINQIAFFHSQRAEKIHKTHHIEALQKWNDAKKYYNQSLKLNGNHLTAMLGYARCLIMLSKYKPAEKFLVHNAERKAYFRDASERWFLLGMLKRKLQNYDEAKSAIEMHSSYKRTVSKRNMN
jgi:tetratricopeptide (TPR) repeat protein